MTAGEDPVASQDASSTQEESHVPQEDNLGGRKHTSLIYEMWKQRFIEKNKGYISMVPREENDKNFEKTHFPSIYFGCVT